MAVSPSPLHAALGAFKAAAAAALPDAVVKRNEPLPEDISALAAPLAAYINITDGGDSDSVDREALLGTPTRQYSFERVAPVEIHVEAPDDDARTARLYAVAAALVDVVQADRTLGGAVAYADLQPTVSNHEQAMLGSVPLGSLILGLVLVYDTDNPLG